MTYALTMALAFAVGIGAILRLAVTVLLGIPDGSGLVALGFAVVALCCAPFLAPDEDAA